MKLIFSIAVLLSASAAQAGLVSLSPIKEFKVVSFDDKNAIIESGDKRFRIAKGIIGENLKIDAVVRLGDKTPMKALK